MKWKTFTSNCSKISFIVVCHLLFTEVVIYSPSQTGEYRHDLYGISAFRSYAPVPADTVWGFDVCNVHWTCGCWHQCFQWHSVEQWVIFCTDLLLGLWVYSFKPDLFNKGREESFKTVTSIIRVSCVFLTSLYHFLNLFFLITTAFLP